MPMPTFAASKATADPATPLDPCAALITPVDVANVLGIDTAKVAVRTVRGQPAPSVRRTDRLDCRYTGEKGRDLFDIRTNTFTDDAAATEQWQRNVALEDGTRRDLRLGGAQAALFNRHGEALMTLVDGKRTVAIEVPDKTVPDGRGADNLIIDFTQRVLKIGPDATSAPATGMPPQPGPPDVRPTPPPTGPVIAGASG